MKFQTKEELFHDIPAPGSSYYSRGYPKDHQNFVQFYYEKALSDADTRAESKCSSSAKRDVLSGDYQRECKEYFAGSLREIIDAWLDKKAPIVAFPKRESVKTMIGHDLEKFDIFRSNYFESLKQELNSGIRILNRDKYEHRGGFLRTKKAVLLSMVILLLFMAAILLDLPYLLIDCPVQALYHRLLAPRLPWEAGSLAHVIISRLVALVLYGIIVLYVSFKYVGPYIPEKHPVTERIKLVFYLSTLVNPFFLLLRAGMGMSIGDGLEMVRETIQQNSGAGNSDMVYEVLNIFCNKSPVLLMAALLLLAYILVLLVQLFTYLRLCIKQKSEIEKEEKLVYRDIDSQKMFCEDFYRELRNADRQLKFMDMWNEVSGKGQHFPGWFDIEAYVRRTEQALLEEVKPYWDELDKKESRRQAAKSNARPDLIKEIRQLREKEDQAAQKAFIQDEKVRMKARVDIMGYFGGDSTLTNPRQAFILLEAALGYQDLLLEHPCIQVGFGSSEYKKGLSYEKSGILFEDIKDNYEAAAYKGYLPALARLANIYALDYTINEGVAYGDSISQAQWSHPLEREATQAQALMGLTPKAPLSTLLRFAWNEKNGFDHEVLYNLAVCCYEDRKLDQELKNIVYLFVGSILSACAEKGAGDDSAQAAYYLARMNYECLGDKTSARMWAETAAGMDGAQNVQAMHFLYQYQKELGLTRKEGDSYCYRAWENRYPPARVCQVWDKLSEESKKEREQMLNEARREALSKAIEREKKARMEAYKNQLEANERIFNAFVYKTILNNEGAVIEGKMTMEEYLGNELYKENKLSEYKKKIDQELE